MPRTIRSINLDLIRWLKGGQKPTAEKLAHVLNANYVSKMATGDKPISDETAREIERSLSLPNGWLDRDNEQIIRMANPDYELLVSIRDKSEAAKKSLARFINDLQKG
ncbi:MAG: hypothetical protein C9356_14815 [Oleiphilus sp.]|nr:MAG: hypothetical protein C9356_14815 [Oleiphilus sp.]